MEGESIGLDDGREDSAPEWEMSMTVQEGDPVLEDDPDLEDDLVPKVGVCAEVAAPEESPRTPRRSRWATSPPPWPGRQAVGARGWRVSRPRKAPATMPQPPAASIG